MALENCVREVGEGGWKKLREAKCAGAVPRANGLTVALVHDRGMLGRCGKGDESTGRGDKRLLAALVKRTPIRWTAFHTAEQQSARHFVLTSRETSPETWRQDSRVRSDGFAVYV